MSETTKSLEQLTSDVDYLQYQIAIINDDISKLHDFLRDFRDWNVNVNTKLNRLGDLVGKAKSNYENVTNLISGDIWKVLMNDYEGGETVIGKERDRQTNQGVV